MAVRKPLVLNDNNIVEELQGSDSLPGVGGSSSVRIVVLGDSLSTQNFNMSQAWPAILEHDLRQCGADVQVFNSSVSGHSFYRANNTASFGSNTSVQHAIDLDPDIVIVALGFNDTVMNVDGRSLVQVQADSLATFTALRAGLPTAKILYLAETPYDTANYATPATTLPNKGTIGILWQKKTSGYLQNLWTVEILGDNVGATNRGRVNNWKSLNASILTYTQIDVLGEMNLWKMHRMGAAVYDMLHLGPAASALQAAYALKSLTNAAFSTLLPELLVNGNTERNDPDALFSGMFTFTAGSWVMTGTSNTKSVQDSLWRQLRPGNWYLPRDINIRTNVQDGTCPLREDQAFVLSVSGAKPLSGLSVSVNGGAFSTPGSLGTNPQGSYLGTSPATHLWRAYGYGPNTFVHSDGESAFDPITFTFFDATSSSLTTVTASRNLALSDCFSTLIGTGMFVPNTLTVQNDSTVAWPAHAVVTLLGGLPSGSGFVGLTVAAGAGVTVYTRTGGGLSITGSATLERIAANTWFLTGNTS